MGKVKGQKKGAHNGQQPGGGNRRSDAPSAVGATSASGLSVVGPGPQRALWRWQASLGKERGAETTESGEHRRLGQGEQG